MKTLTVFFYIFLTLSALGFQTLNNRIKTIEAGLINSIQLPREHWICTDVLRDGDGLVECKTWENIN